MFIAFAHNGDMSYLNTDHIVGIFPGENEEENEGYFVALSTDDNAENLLFFDKEDGDGIIRVLCATGVVKR